LLRCHRTDSTLSNLDATRYSKCDGSRKTLAKHIARIEILKDNLVTRKDKQWSDSLQDLIKKLGIKKGLAYSILKDDIHDEGICGEGLLF